MGRGLHRAGIGQWYLRSDRGEVFQVIGYDDRSGTIEIQTFDGDLDEIELEVWREMRLDLAAPPEDWTGPVDMEDGDPGDLATWTDGSAPVEPSVSSQEAWEDSTAEEEIDLYTERADPRQLS